MQELEMKHERLLADEGNGSIPVDNNRAENAIRPFVVGRKNWLFSTSPKGAKASAIIYSLAATAVANGLNVETYFTDLCQMKQILPWKEEPNHDPTSRPSHPSAGDTHSLQG